MDAHRISNESLDVVVNAQGAELSSIRHHTVGEVLWQAEPIWPQHAPNLFPIVGQLAGDRLHVDGTSYPLKRHGFARNRRFAWVEREAASCRLLLRDDESTLAQFPFAFELEIVYTLHGAELHVRFVIRNSGTRTLPASIGAHPAFRWPLADGIARDAHTLTFERAEVAPIRRLDDGLLKLEGFPTPIVGRTLDLRDDLFAADAIVMDELASTSVRYTAPGAPSIAVAWNGFAQLGIWSKPGAAFVCIEPWHGYASPVDFDGPFATKPGIVLIEPGRERVFSLSIAVAGVASGS